MKKYITYLLATALVGSAFVSCTERFQEGEMRVSTHKVHFSASEVETRTGLSIDGTTVTPNWNKTALESIHLFEIDANDAVAYGETIAITTSEDKATAHFEADFPTDMSIIVDPSDPEEDSGAKGASNGATKGTRVSPYRYAAIIAQKPDKNNFTFVVPGEQHPDAETLKDPDADFLIGYSRKAYDTEHFFDEPVVDLYFDRVAALGRLAISNFAEDDGMVKSVTINAQNGLTGSASYADIDFENSKVNFVREEGPGAIALVYDGGMDIPADGPFYAYFVAIPGSATITCVEVVTDHYRYTKTIEGGKELTFSEKAFKSMNLDLSTATREEVAPSDLTWYKASVLEDGIDYIIVSNGYALKNNGSKAVVAAQTVEIVDGTISLEETEGLIWTANANSEFTEYGTHTLSNGTEHLWRHSDNGTFTLEANNEAITKYMVWNYDGEYLWNISIYTGSGSAQISDYYAYYSSGWKISTTKTAATLFTSRAPQELAFTPAASAEYDLATSEWIVAVPTLSGAKTVVTYALSEDSNPAVATVDADGTVHPLSMGTVTIVATAAGDEQYQAATASYTLRVINSNIQSTRYILTSTLEAGKNYLVVSGGQALKNNGGNVASYAVTPADGVIEIESGMETDLVWTSKAEGGFTANGHFSLANGGYRMNRVSNSGNFSLSLVEAASAMDKYGVWDLQSYNGNTYLFHDSSNTMRLWVYYDGGWKVTYAQNSTNPTSAEKPTQLYVEDDGRLPQTPSFSPKEVNYDMAGSAALVKPTLSNAIGTVTYSSSNDALATVDPSSGDVTVKKVGTVEITASAAGNSQYNPGSASYTLVITNSSSTAPVWYKAEEIEDGETYLIVSNGYLLENDGSSAGAAVDLGVSGDSFEFEADDALIWTATASSGKFRLGNNGQVLRLSSSTYGGSSFQIGTASSTESNNQWELNAQALLMISSNYFYYSTSQTKWSLSTSASDTHTAYLYGSHAGRQAQTLAFSATSVNYDIAGGAAFTAPTLSGAQTAVTYSSSKTAIATVDASTGAVTIIGTGTTVITANAEGTSTIKPATASYTIHVTDSSSPVTGDTYVKVTSASDLVAGAKYILVYESGSKVFKPTLNGSNFTTTGNALDVSISDETIISDDLVDCQMTLEDGYYFYVSSVSRYLYPTYNNMGAEETKSSSHSFNISISNGTATISRTSNNTTYNLRYSTSSSYFQSATSSANVALYKLDNP